VLAGEMTGQAKGYDPIFGDMDMMSLTGGSAPRETGPMSVEKLAGMEPQTAQELQIIGASIEAAEGKAVVEDEKNIYAVIDQVFREVYSDEEIEEMRREGGTASIKEAYAAIASDMLKANGMYGRGKSKDVAGGQELIIPDSVMARMDVEQESGEASWAETAWGDVTDAGEKTGEFCAGILETTFNVLDEALFSGGSDDNEKLNFKIQNKMNRYWNDEYSEYFQNPLEISKYTKISDSDKYRLNSGFYRSNGSFHSGWDIHAIHNVGVKINSIFTQEGIVTWAGYSSNGGNGIEVNYTIQNDKNIFTYYGHAEKINVDQGDIINKNTILGSVGNSGIDKSKGEGGNHLHFSVYSYGNPSFVLDKIVKERGGSLNKDRYKRGVGYNARWYYNPYRLLNINDYTPWHDKTYFK
jgi:murein DD-endopeptidase MepM/ murein hydrolase activator NlpD